MMMQLRLNHNQILQLEPRSNKELTETDAVHNQKQAIQSNTKQQA